LSGVYRKYFIQNKNNVVEKNITVEDLVNADEIVLTNALNCEVKVQKLFISPTEFISFQN